MKRIPSVLCAFLGLCLPSQMAKAEGCSRDIEAALEKAREGFCLAAAEDYQRFSSYYFTSPIDWILYYKFIGPLPNRFPNCTSCWDSKTQFAPAFPYPTMQWAVPNSALTGPPAHLTNCMPMMPR